MSFLLTTHTPFGTAGGHVNKEFWSTLLELDDKINVHWLRDRDVRKAVISHEAAFKHDATLGYARGGPKNTPDKGKSKALALTVAFHAWIRTKFAITVGEGASLVVATPPSSGPKTPKEWILRWTVLTVFQIADKLSPLRKEREKRGKEIEQKLAAIIGSKFGERVKEMIYVDLVATAPESQGHGYASALLDTITRLADTLGEACWLISGNILNQGYYNDHGFKSVGDTLLGDDNPSWHDMPVVVQVMVREPKLRAGSYA